MADRGDTHYFTHTLNKWFLFSSLFLLLATVWMMLDDWNSPWKRYQREFRRVEIEKTKRELSALETPPTKEQEAALNLVVERAKGELAGRQRDLDFAESALFQAKGDQYVKEQAAKLAKADFDWTRYLIEEHRTHTGDLTADQDKLDAALERVNITSKDKEEGDLAFKAAQKKVDDLRASVTSAEKALAAGTRDLERLRTRLEKLEPTDKAVKLANVVRDAPGLDFVGPSLRVEKAVLDNLTFELNFTKSTRVDMCMTCHVAIDRPGFDGPDDKEPLRTHPNLDLFLTAKSPHPLKDVGCTICHRGGGEALDFVRADHRPADEKQEEEWKAVHGWHKQHHWDYPMLSESFIEASCVQCHKTSMDLIADSAPTVSEGYRLFERYGCYSCHKVDWFPTSRKPGPSLKKIQEKVTPDFMAAWITKPKAFRPTTWMPQIFHLENFAENEVLTKSNYGAGRDILGKEWNETSVAAVTAFLLDRAPKAAVEPVPIDGDGVRGREVFRVSGCLACHNLAPYPGTEAKTRDLAFERTGENEHGPNLRGVATKINREWLYWWIKDPTKYWPDTRMPNLRLSDQDAADITAYMIDDPDGIFHDVPAGWQEKSSAIDRETLREQARWFFSKLGRGEITRRLEGQNPEFPWNDDQKLKIAVGEQIVTHQGCFSCHEIKGMEEMQPIGTELTNWGSKTVDKLDFGFAYQPLGSDRTELGGLPLLDHEYREGWLMRKLHAPRSFDLQKIKNPKEKLRMPWFDFTAEENQAIATFVVGLVDDEVQHAKMVPTPQELAMEGGLRALRQKNCVGCHVIEPSTVAYRDDDGRERRVAAELLPLEGYTLPPPMDGLDVLHDYIAKYEKDNEEEVEELGFRLLEPEPGVGAPSETVFIKKAELVGVTPPRGGDFVRTVVSYYVQGVQVHDPEASDPDEAVTSVTADPDGEGKVQDVDGKFRGYAEEPYDKIRWTFAPPILVDEGAKVQREWFYSFLNDPMPLREQMRARMPTFHFADGEAGAIADYFAERARQTWPSRFAKALRLTAGMKLKSQFADRPDRWWPQVVVQKESLSEFPVAELAAAAGLDARIVEGIEAGSKPEIDSGLEKLRAAAAARGFHMHGPVSASYERVRRRAPTYLAQRDAALAQHNGPLQLGQELAVKGVNCYQCHFHAGAPPDQKEAPISWAPDLARVHERLREDWTEDWLWNPAMTYPGTSMPGNFQGDPPQYQQVYPNSTNTNQVEAVLDWLFNFERAAPNAQ